MMEMQPNTDTACGRWVRRSKPSWDYTRPRCGSHSRGSGRLGADHAVEAGFVEERAVVGLVDAAQMIDDEVALAGRARRRDYARPGGGSQHRQALADHAAVNLRPLTILLTG